MKSLTTRLAATCLTTIRLATTCLATTRLATPSKTTTEAIGEKPFVAPLPARTLQDSLTIPHSRRSHYFLKDMVTFETDLVTGTPAKDHWIVTMGREHRFHPTMIYTNTGSKIQTKATTAPKDQEIFNTTTTKTSDAKSPRFFLPPLCFHTIASQLKNLFPAF